MKPGGVPLGSIPERLSLFWSADARKPLSLSAGGKHQKGLNDCRHESYGAHMAPSADFERFRKYYQLADQLIDGSTKEQLAECARVLALNLAYYQIRFGGYR